MPSLQIASLTDIQAGLHTILYETPKLSNALEQLELKIGVKREHLAYGVSVLLALCLVVGHSAQFVCNLLGVVYPAYAAIKAIRSKTKDDIDFWLTYWTIFGLLSFLDFYSEDIWRVFPIIYLLKATFLLILSLPQMRAPSVRLMANFDKLHELQKKARGKSPPPEKPEGEQSNLPAPPSSFSQE